MSSHFRIISALAILLAFSYPPLTAAEAAGTMKAGAAEITSYRIIMDKKGVNKLGYKGCNSCPTRWLTITTDSQLLLRQQPVSLAIAKIYQGNEAYVKYDSAGNLKLLIASAQ